MVKKQIDPKTTESDSAQPRFHPPQKGLVVMEEQMEARRAPAKRSRIAVVPVAGIANHDDRARL